MRTVTKVVLAVAMAALPVAVPFAGARAQSYFGQNQVQYDHFKWKVLETEHSLLGRGERRRSIVIVAMVHDGIPLGSRALPRAACVVEH